MDVKWIKLMTDMFDNRKIRYLRRLPEGNSIVLIWVMLLSLAGRCNAGGMIHLTRDIPYTPKMLADELDFEENTVVLALKALESLGMISQDPLSVTNWEEYQSTEKLDQIREQTRKRVADYRARQKAISDGKKQDGVTGNVTCNATVTQSNATEEDIDIDVDIEKEKDTDISISERKKEKRKKEDAEPQTDSADESNPAPEALAVFRSALEREYKKLSPDLRQKQKEAYGEYMDTIRGYLAAKPEMSKADAENVCRMLDWLYHGDVEGWIGMLKCRGGHV